MTTVLAAIDNSAASKPVLETAAVLAECIDAAIEALHITEGAHDTASAAAQAAHVPLTIDSGDPAAIILERLRQEGIALAVLGLRGEPGGRRPAGSTAIAVAEGAHKPVVVVPPDYTPGPGASLRRVLIPLDGTEASARSSRQVAGMLAGSGVEVIVLHVFDKDTVPAFWDSSRDDFDEWSHEFLARFAEEYDAELDLRTGALGENVLSVGRSHEVDLIVLEWAQRLTPGHAEVIREVLARTDVPVLLLPVGDAT
ncbi:MAG: universal stress protein [Acidimicrobiia bacterium]|nr:universal stress protein [Acidimicrobiia bacterium]MDX2465990.1 universal stress protein [Acidimicrobiia bacterium]